MSTLVIAVVLTALVFDFTNVWVPETARTVRDLPVCPRQ